MKNTIKISIMSGLVTAGVLLCGVHIANAQTNIDSGYTVLIPSEVTIDKESGKGSFSVSGKMDAQTELDVTTTSQNNYKLKCGSQFVDYTLDKQSFHIDNIKSANPKNFNEDFNITLANTNTNYSGPYKDRLAFNIQCHKYTYELDMNSILDGVRENERHNYGAVDVYINGVLKAENVSDFKEILNYGDTYEFKNIKATDGHHFVGINSCANTSIKGRIGADTNYLETRRDNPYNLVAPIYFEFNTNKLTINYHADGAQTWIHFDSVTYDVSGKDTAGSETHLFGSYYDEKHGLGDVRRLTKKGYTAKPNTWIVGKNGTKEVSDNVGLAKSQDVAEYCGVLDEFKKNDTTIDLYPIWTANTYTLTVNPNGGLINGDGSPKVLDTKLRFNTGNCWDISYLKPTRKGFEFLGWYDAPENGNIVYDSNGKCINNGNYWKDSSYVNPNNLTVYAQWKKVSYSAGTVLNIEGSDYIVMGQTDNGNYQLISGTSIGNIQYNPNTNSDGSYKIGTYETPDDKRLDGQYSNTYEGSYIDNYLENTWYEQLSDNLKNAIQKITITQTAWENIGSDSKWKYLTKNSSPPSPDGTYDWFFNEGTESNPRWVHIDYANTPNNVSGAHPFSKWKKRSIGYENQKYNAILRHAFLPSVEELNKIINLENANKTYSFLRGTNNSVSHIWTRDSSFLDSYHALNLSYRYKSISYDTDVTNIRVGVRPAFVIDLSKIDYTVTGTVNYK